MLEIDIRHRFARIDLEAALRTGGETIGLVGPSGAGKSSVLRAVAGLLRPDTGRIALDGEPWFDATRGVDVRPEARRIGIVFQDGALFPHLSVAQNVSYGARRAGHTREHRRAEVLRLLERFRIGRLASARPPSLSGGERQRVALARAVASDPVVLLLDEPLAALDPVTKAAVAGELRAHLLELRLPTILVSHDFQDVVGLAERIAVMEDGRVVQVGTAEDLLQAPVSPFVAALSGVNYFAGTAVRRGVLTEVRAVNGEARFLSTDEQSGTVGVVVYPWDVAVAAERPEGSSLNALAGPVARMATIGNRVRVTVASTPPIVAEVTGESAARLRLAPGAAVVATWKATGTRLVPRPG
jgi:molybdate transport system ATP-binding protein